MINYLEKLILNNREKWTSGVKPKRLDFLKTHAGQATRNRKIGFFVFANKEPIIFAKTVRESKYNKIIEDGFEKLKSIYKILNDDSTPKPIYLGNHQGIAFSLETVIVGKQFRNWKKQGDLEKFLNWFFKFQKLITQKEKKMIQARDFLSELVRKFLTLYKIEKDSEQLIVEIHRSLERDINQMALPSIIQHGDLTPDNVINDKGKIKVIDWDNFNKIDLPAFDLLVFLQRWSGIRDISFVHKFSNILEKYLEEFNIDKRTLGFLIFSYYLLDFIRKKEALTNYDKEYLEERLKEIKQLNFKI